MGSVPGRRLEAETADDLPAAFAAELEALDRKHGGMPLAVRIEVTGRTSAHAKLVADQGRWTNELRSAAIGAAGGRVWVEKVKLLTQPLEAPRVADVSGPVAALQECLEELTANDDKLLLALAEALADLRGSCPRNCRKARTGWGSTTRTVARADARMAPGGRAASDGGPAGRSRAMRFLRLDLLAVGPFTGQRLEFGTRTPVGETSAGAANGAGLHIVYGPNERQKFGAARGAARAVRLPRPNHGFVRHTNPQLRVGGLLEADDGARLEFVRRKGNAKTLRDAADAEPIDEGRLASCLGVSTRRRSRDDSASTTPSCGGAERRSRRDRGRSPIFCSPPEPVGRRAGHPEPT